MRSFVQLDVSHSMMIQNGNIDPDELLDFFQTHLKLPLESQLLSYTGAWDFLPHRISSVLDKSASGTHAAVMTYYEHKTEDYLRSRPQDSVFTTDVELAPRLRILVGVLLHDMFTVKPSDDISTIPVVSSVCRRCE